MPSWIKNLQMSIYPQTPMMLKDFWSGIWSNESGHRKDAEWLKELRSETVVNCHDDMRIDIDKLKAALKKMPNWKAPEPDLVQGFWLKNMKSMHTRLVDQLNMCLEIGEVPEWTTKGRTLLFVKDTSPGNDAGNYRPITCLPLMWKLLTGMISEDVYWFLDEMDLLPEEQKGTRKGSRLTHDLLFIDKMILQSSRNGKKNLFMAWIDYRKAYDMLPHSWIN